MLIDKRIGNRKRNFGWRKDIVQLYARKNLQFNGYHLLWLTNNLKAETYAEAEEPTAET
jgi:hypothetical protein